MSQDDATEGVLLINLGTPASPAVADVRRYLREFLGDPRVVDLPAPARWALLNLLILPFRPRKTAAAYARIWTPRGSPLLLHSEALREALAERLGPGFRVEMAMRYGEPALDTALQRLAAAGVRRVTAVPLFPQYADSTTGSALEHLARLLCRPASPPEVRVVEPFYQHPGFVSALAAVTAPALEGFRPDHLLMSFHGLPERHLRKGDPGGRHCLRRPDCCDAVAKVNRRCYRAHCFATARALAAALGLGAERTSVSFQSRTGGTPWIKPYTDLYLNELAGRGVRRLAVLCPSFVSDCLETLEEIGIRGRAQWTEAGGEALRLIPCLNAHPCWVEALEQMVRGPAVSLPPADPDRVRRGGDRPAPA